MTNEQTKADKSVDESVTEKRSRWENIEVVKADASHFNVVNWSYNDVSEHTYTVEVNPETGEPKACLCGDFKHRKSKTGDSCKHMVCVSDHIEQTEANEVEITPDTSADTTAVADGGTVTETPTVEGTENSQTDIEDMADKLGHIQPDARVTVLVDGEISIRTERVVLSRFFRSVEDIGFQVLEMYPDIADSGATEIVVKRQ